MSKTFGMGIPCELIAKPCVKDTLRVTLHDPTLHESSRALSFFPHLTLGPVQTIGKNHYKPEVNIALIPNGSLSMTLSR